MVIFRQQAFFGLCADCCTRITNLPTNIRPVKSIGTPHITKKAGYPVPNKCCGARRLVFLFGGYPGGERGLQARQPSSSSFRLFCSNKTSQWQYPYWTYNTVKDSGKGCGSAFLRFFLMRIRIQLLFKWVSGYLQLKQFYENWRVFFSWKK